MNQARMHHGPSPTILLSAILFACRLGGSPAAADEAPAAAFVSARWIAPPTDTPTNAALPLFRKDFSVDRTPRRATLRIIGLGDYDARVNGRRLAGTGMNQPWSQYEKTLYYRDYDVTRLVKRGHNTVGVMLANSFWHNGPPPKGRYFKWGPQRSADEPLLLRTEIILEAGDGSVRRIGTDDTWRVSEGPVTFSHIFAGEDYDARRDHPGWDRPGFDDRAWPPARVATGPDSTTPDIDCIDS